MGAFRSIKISDNTNYEENNQNIRNNEIVNYHILEQKSAQQFEDFIQSCKDDGLFDDTYIDVEESEKKYFMQDYDYIDDCNIIFKKYEKPNRNNRKQCYCYI